MSEAVDSGINVNDSFELSNDDNTSTTTPLSSRRESRRSIPLVTFSTKTKGNEENNSEENGSNKIKHRFLNDIQEKAHNLQNPENLVTVIKVRSILVLIGIICTVIILFQIPIILYYTDIPNDDLFTISEVNFVGCTGNPLKPSTEELLKICNISNISEDCINSSAIKSLHTVYRIGLVVDEYQLRVPVCPMEALSFFCSATLFLCGEIEIFNLINMCLDVRDRICALEWRAVESFLNTPVPNCASYGLNSNLTFSKSPLPSCPDNFGVFCDSVCLPVCGEYIPYGNEGSNVHYTFVSLISIWGTVGLIGGIVTLIACYYNRRKLFHFPQIYTVYNTVVNTVYLLLVVIPNIMKEAGDSRLLCSNRNFLTAINEPTTFCQMQGFLLHFGFFCFLGFWCFHLFHLFHGLAFPYQAKHWMDHKSIKMRIHIMEVLIVLVCGLVPPIITITISNYQDSGTICIPRSTSIIFYSEIVPYVIIFVIGLCFLFCSLWILRKKHHLESRNIAASKVFCLHCTTPETKLYLLFFYYAITMMFVIYARVTFLLSIDAYNTHTDNYIFCSAGGFNEQCEMYREDAEQTLTATLVLAFCVGILLSFLNLSHLLYVVNISNFIKGTKKCVVACCK